MSACKASNKQMVVTPTRQRHVRIKKTWTKNEKEIMLKEFANYIDPDKPYPPMRMIEKVKMKYRDIFKDRAVSGMYMWIQGEKRRRKAND